MPKSKQYGLQGILNDTKKRKRLAKYVTLHCFRNTYLEDLHAGISPSTKDHLNPYSDVKVVGPFGEIPWAKVSRLSDTEMKELMIECVNMVYMTLTFLQDHTQAKKLEKALGLVDPLPEWNDPELEIK